MAIKEVAANTLAHIKDGQLDAKALQQFCNSFSVGPLTINYCVDLSVPQVTFSVTLAGVTIGSGTLDAQTPSVTLGGSVAGFTAQVTLTADFGQTQVTYDITLCAPFVGCTQHTGILFSW
ncbi:MAG TPA: hypothetical protein VF618_02370 [Thermoanaerobaculia bacterium]